MEGFLLRDGPDHLRMRRIAAKAFTPRAADRHRPFMREVMNRLIGEGVAADGRCDAVAALTHAYPILVICRVLGAPEADEGRLTTQEVLNAAASVIMAGTDTTRNQLAIGLHLFAERPEQRSALADPAHLEVAVDELLRFDVTRSAPPHHLGFAGTAKSTALAPTSPEPNWSRRSGYSGADSTGSPRKVPRCGDGWASSRAPTELPRRFVPAAAGP